MDRGVVEIPLCALAVGVLLIEPQILYSILPRCYPRRPWSGRALPIFLPRQGFCLEALGYCLVRETDHGGSCG